MPELATFIGQLLIIGFGVLLCLWVIAFIIASVLECIGGD